MNQSTADRHYANGDGNLYALDKHLDAEDERAKQLEEFQELIKQHLNTIEESIFHIRNISESFEDLDLDDEIKSSILEML